MTGINNDVDPVLTAVLDTVLDAVVIMTPSGEIVGWNGAAEQTFGWTWPEVDGRTLADVIVPVQHREAHRKGLERIALGGAPHVLNRRIEITALREDGEEIPVELSITRTSSLPDAVFVGFIRDITERRDAETALERKALESRLMFEIASMAAESESFEAALRKALESICEITNWPVGHAFIVSPIDPNLLRSSGVWVEAREGVAEPLKKATEAILFTSRIGLPGRILESGEPLWIADTDADNNFPRKGLGFRGAFGFPLKGDGRTVAILEFFSADEAPPEPEILMAVRAIGEQVGRVFERKRTQDHRNLLLHELNHRVKNILAVVQAVAQQTFRRADSVSEAASAFGGRLRAIAKAQDQLVFQDSKGATLRDIIEGALDGSGVSISRVSLEGPTLLISARNAAMVSLAIHELCTNAFKYGALSVDGGTVEISWEMRAEDEPNLLFFQWREVGGPPVRQPERRGFGSSLLERGLGAELGGVVSMNYAPDGVVCTFKAPIPSLS